MQMGVICFICYESEPRPIQSGCACRADGGSVHIECLVEVAVSQSAHRGSNAWAECQTCKQEFTGAVRTGLAEAWWARMRDADEESNERWCAAHNLAQSLKEEGRYAEAERIHREVNGIMTRVLGAEHPETLTSACEIASCLRKQAKHAKAEQINREVHAVQKRLLGAEHHDTLTTAANLATTLSDQGKYAEAEQLNREVHAIQSRVLVSAHADHCEKSGGRPVPPTQICRSPAAVRGYARSATARARGYTSQHAEYRGLVGGHAVAHAHGGRVARQRDSRSGVAVSRRNSRGGAAARRQARAQRQGRARAIVRQARRAVHGRAGRRQGALAQARVRGSGRVRGGGMRVRGGEQRVRAVRGGAVLLTRVPAGGLEGAQAGVRDVWCVVSTGGALSRARRAEN
jgi:hypothetical protein